MSNNTEEERVYTEQETYQYYYKMWESLGFPETPNIDEGIYCDMVENDPMVEYGYKYQILYDKCFYEGYDPFDALTELYLYIDTKKLKGYKSK